MKRNVTICMQLPLNEKEDTISNEKQIQNIVKKCKRDNDYMFRPIFHKVGFEMRKFGFYVYDQLELLPVYYIKRASL